MFVNEKVLKRLIKAAFKGMGLHIEHTSEGWLAMSGYMWNIEVDYQKLPNKIKAQIVELVGEIPSPGEGYLYLKGYSPQSEIPGMTYRNYMKEYDNPLRKYSFTNILIKTSENNLSVLESPDDDKIFVPEYIEDLIDENATEEGELKPEPGASSPGSSFVIWRNNVMALAAHKRDPRYAGERQFLEAVEGQSLRWEFDDED
ncbi:MAG: hypothetical protein IKO76_06640 [Butyrivibrio sp.]|nr:hypothetical protein [Butyrivibrio sp.]